MKRLFLFILTSLCIVSTFAQEEETIVEDYEVSDHYEYKPYKEDNGFGMKFCFAIPNKDYSKIKNKNEDFINNSKPYLTFGAYIENRFYVKGNARVRFGINARWLDFDVSTCNRYVDDNTKIHSALFILCLPCPGLILTTDLNDKVKLDIQYNLENCIARSINKEVESYYYNGLKSALNFYGIGNNIGVHLRFNQLVIGIEQTFLNPHKHVINSYKNHFEQYKLKANKTRICIGFKIPV